MFVVVVGAGVVLCAKIGATSATRAVRLNFMVEIVGGKKICCDIPWSCLDISLFFSFLNSYFLISETLRGCTRLCA